VAQFLMGGGRIPGDFWGVIVLVIIAGMMLMLSFSFAFMVALPGSGALGAL
jgi:hypothetical protein